MGSIGVWEGLDLIFKRQQQMERNMRFLFHHLGLAPVANDPESTTGNYQTNDKGAGFDSQQGEK